MNNKHQKATKAQLASLVQRLKQADNKAFDSLFYLFEQRIYSFALKLTHNPDDAKEIVQETFIKVWEKRKTLDPSSNFEGYLFTVSKNLVYNKARKRVSEFAYKNYIRQYFPKHEYTTEQQVDYHTLFDLVQKVIDQMPPIRRKVFTMSRFGRFSNQQIADELNTSTSNIKNHINKALDTLRTHISDHGIVLIIALLC